MTGRNHGGAEEYTRRLGLQLYSIAGAKPNVSLEPVSRRMLDGFCTLLGSRTLYPVTRVFQLWRHVTSSENAPPRQAVFSGCIDEE